MVHLGGLRFLQVILDHDFLLLRHDILFFSSVLFVVLLTFKSQFVVGRLFALVG